MRRRQEWVANPPIYVPTEIKPINESVLPKEANRRRALYTDPSEVAQHWDRCAKDVHVCHGDNEIELIEDVKYIEPEQKRRPGRPRKEKQASD